ncbi:hypothetical protein R3P38DRAFT_3127968 [Favolaschia claudopus]|uniref:Secreted protein n=1 Tax=Favolaschia claudopus TaxID=2862362 RepID=A0AAV9Z9T8_9AGAR
MSRLRKLCLLFWNFSSMTQLFSTAAHPPLRTVKSRSHLTTPLHPPAAAPTMMTQTARPPIESRCAPSLVKITTFSHRHASPKSTRHSTAQVKRRPPRHTRRLPPPTY